MKKSISITFLLNMLISMPAVNAALLMPGSTGTIVVTRGCMSFALCDVNGEGAITDNDLTVNGIGSGIAGDGVVGIMKFIVGHDGNSFQLTSYNMDSYAPRVMGIMPTRIVDLSAAGGVLSDNGELTLTLTGRTAIGLYLSVLGERLWNLDTHQSVQP